MEHTGQKGDMWTVTAPFWAKFWTHAGPLPTPPRPLDGAGVGDVGGNRVGGVGGSQHD